MKQHKFAGTGVAIVTPFLEQDRQIDYANLEGIIEHLISGGIDYIVSLGTTGEAITLSAEECRAVLDFTIKTVAERVPIVAGLFGHNYTEKLARGIKNYNFDGIDAIMSSNPGYSKPTQEGIYQHYMAIEAASPVPIIIYNVPGRTSSNVTAETTLRLAHSSSKFLGVKEASGDLDQAMKIMKERPEGFLVLCGEDPLTLPMIAAGGEGAISVIANAYPREFSSMVKAALAGDLSTARKLNFDLLDVHPHLYVEGNPVGIKGALETLGLCSRAMRVPLVKMTEPSLIALKKAMNEVAKVKVLN